MEAIIPHYPNWGKGQKSLPVVDAGVGFALDAARVAHRGAAEEHRVERRRAADSHRRLENLRHFLLDEVEESAPARGDSRCVREHLEVRASDRHVLARSRHAGRGLVGRHDEDSARAAEEHVLTTLAQLDRGDGEPARKESRAVAVLFDCGYESSAEAVRRRARRKARERKRARVASGRSVAERGENPVERRAVYVFGGEAAHRPARAHPVLHLVERGQGEVLHRNGIRWLPLSFVGRLSTRGRRSNRGFGDRSYAAGCLVQTDETAAHHVI